MYFTFRFGRVGVDKISGIVVLMLFGFDFLKSKIVDQLLQVYLILS